MSIGKFRDETKPVVVKLRVSGCKVTGEPFVVGATNDGVLTLTLAVGADVDSVTAKKSSPVAAGTVFARGLPEVVEGVTLDFLGLNDDTTLEEVKATLGRGVELEKTRF